MIAEGRSVTYDMKRARDDPTAVGTSEVADAIIEKLEGTRLAVAWDGHGRYEFRAYPGRRKVTVVGAGAPRGDVRRGPRAPRLRGGR